ncbi:hypothetical protein K402DRAFT_326501 [Aulographum hederae CBS 113979]|uniref:non-specific serine/threonine protein kinase n=1 Tax=Aulographum hederae CBS 113979 TaxID=1176131 RepID=A0A6G1H9V1_9PEZI|nr:hypothetical protein K402DRAFT_326501 [Aulographum hederae CBS 113979]
MEEQERSKMLPPPAVAALKEEATGEGHHRGRMARTISEDIREEREDLKEAAEHSLNVIVDLDLDGRIRWVSPSWRELFGTDPDSVLQNPISDILVESKTLFSEAVDAIKADDSRSKIIRFQAYVGPHSRLAPRSPKLPKSVSNVDEEHGTSEGSESVPQHTVELEAQGIIVYDRTSGGESHTMWMIRPPVIREVTIDLPDILVESLGVGAEMLAHYLNTLTESGASQQEQLPPAIPVLCRICERQIPPWWFEKHTEHCLQEHKAEMEVQLAHENLSEHRNAICKVLEALESHSRQSRSVPGDGTSSPVPHAEYKGFSIGQNSASASNSTSGRASPASPASRSRDHSTSGFGHHRARSFAVRRPVSRIVELILDLCDTALEINTPAIKDNRTQPDDFRSQSPQSESRIAQVLQWQPPTTSTVEQDQGLSLLSEDTSKLASAKVDAIMRHKHILEYSERIRIEFDLLVQECIEAAMRKAARIAAGEISSSEESSSEAGDEPENTLPEVDSGTEEGVFAGSFERPSSLAEALRSASEQSLAPGGERMIPSTAASTRSSSPRGAQTPRSHFGAMSIISQNSRASMHFDSDAGADSDTSARSSVHPAAMRTESPGSEVGRSRAASSRDRKRHSLILPSTKGVRQSSPARSIVGMPTPQSPLRMAKNRMPSGTESTHSPVTSPVLGSSEMSSPAPIHRHPHHRRQSSAASSEVNRPPVSPRMLPVTSNPQPRAVQTSIKDFEIIKPISKGAFGSVYLSKKKSTGDYYAIKVLRKNDMVAKNQVTNVKAERAIMMWQSESDFVAKLYWTFSSKDFLYLVMEYLNGGDCASLIKVLGNLPEEWAKKYLAEVVLGVEHLHSRGIVHRDLKPDNLLIDQKGHLKLTDFGLSRMGIIGRQKRALSSKPEEPVPDLLKQGPFHRSISIASSRSASFDLQGTYSPSNTPNMTPALSGEMGQPSYFSLSRESSHAREPMRKTSGHRSDSEGSDALQAMFRKFSLVDESGMKAPRSPIEEETASEGETSNSPDLYTLQPATSHASTAQSSTPPATSMPPPQLALFDPQDANRKFVGTPDYLAPETINGSGQDEMSDWWSLGCILFECLYGYPPFHAETPDQVFENILARKIDWPDEDDYEISEEARDLMNKLLCLEPNSRLGANNDDKFPSGGAEIRAHPWFEGINWETLRDDEASFIPAADNPENTEYFDARGATMFAAEFEDQTTSPVGTPGADYPDRPYDALSRVRSQVNSMKRGLMPLHIPPHVRDARSRRLSEPMAADDFGSFNFKNLPVLEKANKDVIQKLRAEAMQAQNNKPSSASTSPAIVSPTPSLESSPVLTMPLKRNASQNRGGEGTRPVSPLMNKPASSPSRPSQPSSPLLVSFSAGQNHERRKTSNGSSSSSLSQQNSNTSLQPGNFFDVAPRLPSAHKTTSSASSPIKLAKSPGPSTAFLHERALSLHKHNTTTHSQSAIISPRARSQTVGSQESDTVSDMVQGHHKRRSQALDVSPSSSDTEESRQKALLRVQRRRQSSRRLSQITMMDGPVYRPLDVLVCEDHPVSRLVMEKLLEKLRCRTITVQTGPEAMRYAMSEVKFDVIMMEFKLPQINGADVARMIRDTKNANSHTPIIAVTGYLKELQAPHHFDGLIQKPPTTAKLSELMGRLCQWKAPSASWTPAQQLPPGIPPSGLRQESIRADDSPVSNASSFAAMPSGSYRGSSREDSISSSFFGDTDSRGDDISVVISRQATDEWRDRELGRAIGGLGISEEVPEKPPVPPQLHQQASAPASLENPFLKKRAADESSGSRRSLEKTNELAESGDDEDEELGHTQVRAKSPKNRPRGSSKLGTEMMRTNSRGSVISVEDISSNDIMSSSPPPMISEDQAAEARGEEEDKHISITPPEIFPQIPGEMVEEIDMLDTQATPRPRHNTSPDPDPTPRPTSSPPRMLQTKSSDSATARPASSPSDGSPSPRKSTPSSATAGEL